VCDVCCEVAAYMLTTIAFCFALAASIAHSMSD